MLLALQVFYGTIPATVLVIGGIFRRRMVLKEIRARLDRIEHVIQYDRRTTESKI